MKFYFLFIILGLLSKNFYSQVAIKTNVLFPLGYLGRGFFPPGLDLAVDVKIKSKLVLRSSLHARHALTFTEAGGGWFGEKRRRESHYETAGLRLMLKKYRHPSEDKTLQRGFFWGVFSDIFAAQRRVLMIRSADRFVYYNKTEAQGFFFGGGLCFGYTWKKGKWIIEPNLGIGYGVATGGILYAPDPNAFPYDTGQLDNALIQISPTHIELHFGREF